ncbi:MAG TPA: hypothetical protein VH988_04400 [Thermoanaerobaculia bacterium]|jgi:hypothetical protein|nr:hypothetical protein [Thermoanaerobaculia bacterium]
METATEEIDVKGAVKIATSYLAQLYDRTQLQDVLLEEVTKSDDDRFWFVTLGFSRPVPEGTLTTFEQLIQKTGGAQPLKREYKIFDIDATTGKVRGMRIRA